MAHIVISSKGTLGDFVPFVTLGRRLRARGHRVVLAVNPAVLPLATNAGLEALPCGPPLDEVEARFWAQSWDFWDPLPAERLPAALERFDLERDFHDLLGACRGADLLVASVLQTAAELVHLRCGIPWLSAVSSPGIVPHQWSSSAPAAPISEGELTLHAYYQTKRRQLGFPELSIDEWRRSGVSERLLLLASSPLFSQPRTDVYPQMQLTGFWFDEASEDGWTPSRELQDFLDVEPRPLVLTYSSLPLTDPTRVVAVHVEAAALLGRRIIIQRGWANLGPECLADSRKASHVCWADYLPHRWLFPRAAAVIHHGGLGTTAEALRAGCPTLVEPYGNDQFFTAWRTVKLGVGAAMHPHQMTAAGLARLLEEKVLTPPYLDRARELAAKLRREDGVTRACDLIEEQLSR